MHETASPRAAHAALGGGAAGSTPGPAGGRVEAVRAAFPSALVRLVREERAPAPERTPRLRGVHCRLGLDLRVVDRVVPDHGVQEFEEMRVLLQRLWGRGVGRTRGDREGGVRWGGREVGVEELFLAVEAGFVDVLFVCMD